MKAKLKLKIFYSWIAPLLLLPMSSKKRLIRHIGVGLTICSCIGSCISTAAIIQANPGAEYEEYLL